MFGYGGLCPPVNRKAKIEVVKIRQANCFGSKIFVRIVIFCLQLYLIVIISQVLARLLTKFNLIF